MKELKKVLQPVDDANEFFRLYDTLLSHKSGFAHNRDVLLEAWKRGNELYTLHIVETQELFENVYLRQELAHFTYPEDANPSWLNLPVFCWRDAGNACIMLWTAPHIRRLGLAKELLGLLEITRAYKILPESRTFWEHLAIPEVDSL